MSDAPPLLWAVLAGLLCLSGFFSASETALFSLTPAERRRAGPAVARLLADTRNLLVTILLGNLVVNLLYFAFASRLALGRGAYEELGTALVALLVIVVVGEVLPKTLALRARMGVARLGAVPLSALVLAARPVQRAADGLLELIYRMLGSAGRREVGITTEFLGEALERSAEHGLLLDSEAELLVGVVELEEVRVREVMTPRVDMLLIDLRDEAEQRPRALAGALARKSPWVVVTDGNPDQVVGRVRTRDLLTQPGRPLAELLAPVRFVPEVASALHLLHFLREARVSQAVVVDEWGGTAGLVTVEDVFEQVVGDLRVEGEPVERPVERLADGRFRVVGGLSIRDWNELFGYRVVPTEFETLGGWVTALLGRIPRGGDEVRAGGLVFEVREVRRRRVVSLDVRVASDQALEVAR